MEITWPLVVLAPAVSFLISYLGMALYYRGRRRERAAAAQTTITYWDEPLLGKVKGEAGVKLTGYTPLDGNITFTGNPEPFAGLAGVFSPNELRANPELLVAQNLLAIRAELEHGTPITRPAPAPKSAHPPEVQAVHDEASMEAAVRRWDAEYSELCEKHWPTPEPELEQHDELTSWCRIPDPACTADHAAG